MNNFLLNTPIFNAFRYTEFNFDILIPDLINCITNQEN
jgi:hypothetical protein